MSKLKRWMAGWIDGWIDGWMDGWMDRWMDGWMDSSQKAPIPILLHKHTHN